MSIKDSESGFIVGKLRDAQRISTTLTERAKRVVGDDVEPSREQSDKLTIWKRIYRFSEQHGGEKIIATLEEEDTLPNRALLGIYTYVTFLPHLMLLLLRLVGDSETPRAAKIMGLGAAMYVINPLDIVPDILPLIGAADDAGVAAIVIMSIIGMISETPEEVLKKHWGGRDTTITHISGISGALRGLFQMNPRSDAVRRLAEVPNKAKEIESLGQMFVNEETAMPSEDFPELRG